MGIFGFRPKQYLVVSHVPLDDNSATSSVTFRKTVGEVRLSESALDAPVVQLGDDVWVIESDEARISSIHVDHR